MKFIKQLVAATALLGLALLPVSAFAASITQLGFILDGSGSVTTSNYNLLKTGLSDAIAALDADGSVEITVTAYGTTTKTVVAPTLLTAASLATIQNSILTHTKSGGLTDTAGAIRYTTNLLTGSAIFTNADLKASIINLATDGQPNTSGLSIAQSQAAAVAAAQWAFAQGIDGLSIEAIGSGVNSGSALNNMLQIALPGPATLLGLNSTNIPNPIGGSWVVPVSDFDALAPVLKAKVIASVKPPVSVPESSSLILLLVGLMCLGFARKRA